MGSRVAQARTHVLACVRKGMAPGAHVSVKLTAEELRISHTPVREALERLVGEGVLVSTSDRQGFAVPRLTVRDVTGLHLLFGTLLRGLADFAGGAADPAWTPDPERPALSVEEAVAGPWARSTAAMIAASARSVELRLSTYRLVEPSILPDWADGLIALRAGLAAGGEAARRSIDAFTQARVEKADRLVEAVEDRHMAGS